MALWNVLGKRGLVVACAALLGVQAVVLCQSDRAWGEAGRLSRRIVGDIESLGRVERLHIVNLPDNVRGAYVFRSGIVPACRLFCKGIGTDGVTLMFRHGVRGVEEPVSIALDGEGVCCLQAPVGGDLRPHHHLATGRLSEECFEMFRFDRDAGEVRFKFRQSFLGESSEAVFYSAGRIHRMESLGERSTE